MYIYFLFLPVSHQLCVAIKNHNLFSCGQSQYQCNITDWATGLRAGQLFITSGTRAVF